MCIVFPNKQLEALIFLDKVFQPHPLFFQQKHDWRKGFAGGSFFQRVACCQPGITFQTFRQNLFHLSFNVRGHYKLRRFCLRPHALAAWQTQTMQGTDINKVTRSSPAPSNFHAVHAPCARQVMRRAPRPPLSKTTISDNSAMPRLMVSHGSCFRPEKTERCAAFSFLPTSCICKAGQCRYRCNPSGWRDSASHINIH